MPKTRRRSTSVVAPFNKECPVCLCIPPDPIKLPCRHILCLTCFKQNVEITSLNCPLCKRRLSIWTRRLNASGGPTVDHSVQKWLQDHENKPSTSCQVPDPVYNLENSLSWLVSAPGKDTQDYLLNTNLKEQRIIEEQLRRERKDAQFARLLQKSLDNNPVDRSTNSVDAYPLRSRNS
uniref:RING-type E3 ubiquitin transferase n=1 Tax=Caligus clemensi TaxID=344056 RepID=C1C1M8_CALCM|nr:RING finger protein 168 [Caligus clemensi]